MPRFSANLSMLFTEVPFMERFERAAKAGFKAVEYMFPYPFEAERLADALAKGDLTQALFNLPAGDWDAGERGIATLPDRVAEFKEGVYTAIRYGLALHCPLVNCLVGLRPPGVPESQVRDVLVSNLRFAADALAKEDMRLLIESLNTRDIPGFYLSHTADVLALIREVGHPNISYQYDVYHMQAMEGDITTTIRNNIKTIAHIQVADNPGRHEPGTGEINYSNLFRFIDEAGYTGFIGCEYKPLTTTEKGLGWITPYMQIP
jgi:hydroxypyruvate isomerase